MQALDVTLQSLFSCLHATATTTTTATTSITHGRYDMAYTHSHYAHVQLMQDVGDVLSAPDSSQGL
jgi:hypothetical protein